MSFLSRFGARFRGSGEAARLPLSLALQGGGSFGAFTWGVVDRLLDEPGVEFDAISGASAGAVNAVLLAAGLLQGGAPAAKAKLEAFWKRMSLSAAFLPSSRFGGAPMRKSLELLVHTLTPYQFNPFNLNPLRDALVELVDFDALRASPLRLLVGATRVSDGRLRIFRNEDLNVDAVLASTCLPLLHHTVEIDGEGYWDGGYVANPPLIPLALESKAERLLVVQLTPNAYDGPLATSSQILKRLDEIRFNSTLNCELEAIKNAKLFGGDPRLRRLRVGRISAADEVTGLARESAARLDWSFLESLRKGGRGAVETWLAETGLMDGVAVAAPAR